MINDVVSNNLPALRAHFYWRDMEDGQRVLFCRVRVSQYSTWDQPLREQDKVDFASDWEKFQQQEELRQAREEVAQLREEAARTKSRKPKIIDIKTDGDA